jgi:hypothetical protein
VHGRLNVALTVEDRAVEGVLDAITDNPLLPENLVPPSLTTA